MSRLTFTLLIIALVVIATGAYGQSAPGSCGANASWAQCSKSGSSCARDCANHQQTDIACLKRCFPGCQCSNGYVFKSGTSGDCVLPSSC